MERSNSTSSQPGNPSRPSSASGTFAYQTRLLERTSSKRSTHSVSLSRSNSQSGNNILTNPTGSATPVSTRRWTPSHRVTNSLDSVRGKWEERVRENGDDSRALTISPTRTSPLVASTSDDSENSSDGRFSSYRPSSPPVQLDPPPELQRTPAYLKRHTLPAPIIASPLSPNSTGISVEADSPLSPLSTRIHLPSQPGSIHLSSANSRAVDRYLSSAAQTSSFAPRAADPPTRSRATSFDSEATSSSYTSPYKRDNTSTVTPSPSPLKRRPLSYYGSSTSSIDSSHTTASTSSDLVTSRIDAFSFLERSNSLERTSSLERTYSLERPRSLHTSAPSTPTTPSVSVNPPTYRSSYMNKKTYGDSLLPSRRIGGHLPRIASGDGDEHWQEDKHEPFQSPIEEDDTSIQTPRREVFRRDSMKPVVMKELNPRASDIPGVGEGDAVAGIPGRLRLQRNRIPESPTPIPSSKLTRGGLWADVQRHHIQVYEYLCHVGEAKEWIEGCLNVDLDIDVLKMDDGLRDGVVLAKLVKKFTGDSIVRRIYKAPKLSFLHSDNINYFFVFVRAEGLPEGFIFELTDLYEKKNFPKVVYCIHALSHLLVRRRPNEVQPIRNLLGHYKFTDDQLRVTQKGLKDAGVSMPNFGNVGRELAKDLNEEPEIEIETEDERRDRLLLENESSITSLQSQCRGYLARRADTDFRDRMRLIQHYVVKFQAHCRGGLTRTALSEERLEQQDVIPWAVSMQAIARGTLLRKRWQAHLNEVDRSTPTVIKLQAQIRGVLQRQQWARIQAALRNTRSTFVRLQSAARLRLVKQSVSQTLKTFSSPRVKISIAQMQAHARGALTRREAHAHMNVLHSHHDIFISLQSQCRGILTRRRMRKQMAKLEDVSQTVVRIQTACRTYLARKRLLLLIRGLRKATPAVVSFQTLARAKLTRQRHQALTRALATASTVKTFGGLQALVRASLVRNRHREVNRKLDFVAPDMVRFQAAVRGVLARDRYFSWRDHLRNSQPIATMLQALLRGTLQRRKFHAKMGYYRANLSKVVKIQSLFRAKETREQYKQLTMGQNVTIGTIKNFVHLLDDSEADFKEEIKIERLRKQVVEQIRENQLLESDVNDLDVKIALLVENVKTVENVKRFEDLLHRRRRNTDAAVNAARSSLLAEHGDPFSGPNTLEHKARRKLELYQQLFYLLQTRGEYLSRLFGQLSKDTASESNRRFVERVVLTLFGYGQDRREDYLLLKVFQFAIRDEFMNALSLYELLGAHPMYANIAVQYFRPKQRTYAREAFQGIIQHIVESHDLDLETDPVVIYQTRIKVEQMRGELRGNWPTNLTFSEALNDAKTRPEYIRRLQLLQETTADFIKVMVGSTRKMPYSIRYLARETFEIAREKFPDAPNEVYAAAVGRIVFYRYINQVVVTPEAFELVSHTIHVDARKNLSQISKMLEQITKGVEFTEDNPILLPTNAFIAHQIPVLTAWFLEVAFVPDAETQFHAHEFVDATIQPKPIYISPNEIYNVHSLLSQHQNTLAPAGDDPLRMILIELDGVPQLEIGSDELKDARDQVITLELTNRFADVRDPHAEEKALWVQAKRGVLAVLRVQPAQDLIQSFLLPVTEHDEEVWEEILDAEIMNEGARHGRQASQAVPDPAYRLDDIRSLNFKAVKAKALSYLLELEKQGKVSRGDNFQGILNAIAGDVRSKHRKRVQRQQEMTHMNEALRQLRDRKAGFEEQIKSYNSYVKTAMDTMQKGKGKQRFTLPWKSQFFHQLELNRAGTTPKFGSFRYSAKELYQRKILLSIDQYSPRQFDKVWLIMSSEVAGVFQLELRTNIIGVGTLLGTDEVKIEDLLEAKYNQVGSLALFKDQVKMNFENFLYQINKKFYAS